MPRHRNLNLKKFVESIPEKLLKEYFKKTLPRGVSLSSFDYDSVKNFMDGLEDDNLKSVINEQFTHINDICERFMNILVKAAQHYSIKASDKEERQELAMRLFLKHPQAFDYAYDYYCLFNASSKMSYHHIESADFSVSPQKMERFKDY